MDPKRNFLKKAIRGVKDTVSGAASVVAIPFNNLKASRANADADTLRKARQYKGAASFDLKGKPTDANLARTAADTVRMRRGAFKR